MRTDVDMIMVRFGELSLKGRNRHRFEQAVREHMRACLKPYARLEWISTHGRLFVRLNGEPYEAVSGQLNRTFGIRSYSPVVRVELDAERIVERAVELMRGLAPAPRTFKVTTRRPNKSFPLDSQQMNRIVGGGVLRHIAALKVDVHKPDAELTVELRDDYAYILCETIAGLGGYPVGSNGKGLLLLSGGIDSPVAGWMALKRGLALEAVHFHSFPYTSERAQHKVMELAEQLSAYARRVVVHMVPFTDIQVRLKELGNSSLLITLMRRAMMRIASKLAAARGAGALVTGESLGQVASQTLPSIAAIGSAASVPVLQPLIMMDKQEIIDMAERIGTYSISIQPYDDCCTLFVPKSPSTNPSMQMIERLENAAPWLDELIDEAVSRIETRIVMHGDNTQALERFF